MNQIPCRKLFYFVGVVVPDDSLGFSVNIHKVKPHRTSQRVIHYYLHRVIALPDSDCLTKLQSSPSPGNDFITH